MESGVFTLRVKRDGMGQVAPRTQLTPVRVTAVESVPDGVTDAPQVGEKIVIAWPDTVANRSLSSLPDCRVNLVRRRITFASQPSLSPWQYRFPNDDIAANKTDCVKPPSAPPVNEHVAQQTAQVWVTALLQGRVDQVLGTSAVPFSWDNVELVANMDDLKALLDGVVKNKGIRHTLQAGETTKLKGVAPQELLSDNGRFHLLKDVPGVAFVSVKLEAEKKTDTIWIAIDPATHKVIGFSD
jgi:hypothetical protein